MTENEKAIRSSIRRMVAHLAREHNTYQDVIWEQIRQELENNIKP